MKKNIWKIVVTLVLCFCAGFTIASLVKDTMSRQNTPKYVFYMIGDGMGINEVRGTEIYNEAMGKEPAEVNFAHFPVMTICNTHSADSWVTDSGAGGTALSTGVKTNNSCLGVDADSVAVRGIADWAKSAGFGTGAATKVSVNHATPGAFYAHNASRNKYEAIVDDLISSGIDYVAGSGFNRERKEGRLTAEQMIEKIKQSGITVLAGDEMSKAGEVETRLLCLPQDVKKNVIPYAIDRQEGDTKLTDFVKAGIDYLYGRYAKKGFFFMIEGGKIDYNAHSNDAVGIFNEINEFAEAVEMVLAFQKEHPHETLVVVTTDHETGSMTLGAGRYEMHPDRLAWQTNSVETLTKMFHDRFKEKKGSKEEVKEFISNHLGLWTKVQPDEEYERVFEEDYANYIKAGDAGVKNLYSVNSKIVYDAVIALDRAAGILWPHSAHSGAPVAVYATGTASELIGNVRDNTDLPKAIAKAMKIKAE